MTVEAFYYTDPCCPWSWAAEPALRKLQWRFGDTLSVRHVMCGMAQQFGEPQTLISEMLSAGASSGMPVDPRLWLESPLRSSHPACIAVKAAAEQGDPAAYLRRLREGILCRRTKLDVAPALLAEARLTPGLDPARFEVDLASHAILEVFARDLERAKAVPPEHIADGSDRVKLPSLEFRGAGSSAAGPDADGSEVHGVYGPSGYEELRAAALAAGAQESAEPPPPVEEALRHFGTMSTAEVASVCELPGPRAPATLWQLATEWRVRAEPFGSGELWSVA